MSDVTHPQCHTLSTLVSAVTTMTLLYVSTWTHPRDGGTDGCCVDLIIQNDNKYNVMLHHLLSVMMACGNTTDLLMNTYSLLDNGNCRITHYT